MTASNYKRRIRVLKRICLIIISVMILCCVSVYSAEIPPIPMESEDEWSADITLPVDDLLKGDTVYIDITINPKASIYAFEMILTYDEDLLEYKRADISDFADTDIVIEDGDSGKVMLVFSRVGEHLADKSNKLCTLEFLSKNRGKTQVELSSLKAVFCDMTYFSNIDIASIAKFEIRSPKSQNSGSGGGGKRGGGISISGGGVTSVTAPIPPKPQINEPAQEENFETSASYSDVPESFWAYNEIIHLSNLKIINGFQDGTFRPEQNITRAEFAKIILGKEEMITDAPIEFYDVSTDSWYYDFVKTASAIGLINGRESGRFMPDDYITREEAAVILFRYAEYKDADLSPVRMNINFADELSISDFAVGSIDILYTASVLNGSNDGNFYPSSPITRAEASVAVNNLYNLIEREI